MHQSEAALVLGCVCTSVRLFLSSFSWNHPLYLNWEEYVTVTAECVTTSACTQPPLSNTRITCDITFLLQEVSAAAHQQNAKASKHLNLQDRLQYWRIRKPYVAWEKSHRNDLKKKETRRPPYFVRQRYGGFLNRRSHASDALTKIGRQL